MKIKTTKREITLTPKESSIEAGHSLDCFGADHKCARHHGHTWWVRATFAGVPDERGILIDYEVRDVTKEFDHQDLDEVMAPLSPTGEHLLLVLLDRFGERCAAAPADVRVTRVELTEAPTRSGGHVLVWDERNQSRDLW